MWFYYKLLSKIIVRNFYKYYCKIVSIFCLFMLLFLLQIKFCSEKDYKIVLDLFFNKTYKKKHKKKNKNSEI